MITSSEYNYLWWQWHRLFIGFTFEKISTKVPVSQNFVQFFLMTCFSLRSSFVISSASSILCNLFFPLFVQPIRICHLRVFIIFFIISSAVMCKILFMLVFCTVILCFCCSCSSSRFLYYPDYIVLVLYLPRFVSMSLFVMSSNITVAKES